MLKIARESLAARKISSADHPLVYKSLLRSYKKLGAGATGIDREVYFKHHAIIVENILKEDGLCAVSPEDDDLIYGYILFNKDKMRLHYVYVKEVFRHMGIAGFLLSEINPNNEPLTMTHRTSLFRDFLEPKGHYIYNPYLLGESK